MGMYDSTGAKAVTNNWFTKIMIIKTWIWQIEVWGYDQGYLATIKYK